MADYEKKLEELKEGIKTAIDLIKQEHAGANLDEARSILTETGEALEMDDLTVAEELVGKAILAAKPTTEYLLDKAKKLENKGNTAYKKENYANAIEHWEKSLEEYSRVLELANQRKEKEIIEGVKQTVTSIEGDIKTAEMERANREMVSLAEEAKKIADEAEKNFESGNFDNAKDGFESAKKLYAKGAGIAREFGFEDEKKIKKAVKDMKGSIDSCLLSKGEVLIEEASKRKAKEKEDAFSEITEYLDSFSSKNKRYEELKTKANKGIVEGRVEIGTELMKEAENLFKKKEYYKAKESYRKALEHFENLSDIIVEKRLEEQKGEVDNLIDTCTANIRACTDALLGREKVATGRLIKVGDFGKGVRIKASEPRIDEDRREKLGRNYQIEKWLGFGGFSDVYRAKTKKGEIIAIKVPRELDEKNEEVFFREVKIWERLKHRNIVGLIRPRINPLAHLQLEYVDGGSLKELLGKQSLSTEEACRIAFDIAKGVEYAHSQQNVIHGDLTPKNILLTRTGEARITDWGLGKIATSSSMVKGYTPGYAAPEQVKDKKADKRTDVYQLGVLFYEMLLGDNPFYSGSIEECDRRALELIPEKPSSLDAKLEPLDDIAMRCLEKNPKKRPSIREFREALYKYMKEQHGMSLHLSKDIPTEIGLLCRIAMFGAKQNSYADCIDSLLRLKSKLGDVDRRSQVENLIKAMEHRKEEEIEIGDDVLDEIDALLRWVEFGET